MLLGIGLHGVLSFTTFAPFGWSAVDRTEWAGFDIFFLAVHGFRMPLFFLLSGYFATAAWPACSATAQSASSCPWPWDGC